QRRLPEALAELEKARALDDTPDTLAVLGRVYADMGRTKDAHGIIDLMKRQSQQKDVSPFFIAVVYFALGEKGGGFEWLEKAYDERAELMVFLKSDTHFDSVRSDPRFVDMMRRVGIAP